MGTGPHAAVDPAPKVPPDYSLLGSARLPVEPDERWANGFEFRPEACRTGGVDDPCDSTVKAFGVTSNPAVRVFEPYDVWAAAACSTLSQDRVRALPAEARRGLLACESFHVARELSNGALATAKGWPNPFFRSIAASGVLTPAAGVSALDALACLEQGLAECACGARGMIHATRQIVTLWRSQQLVWPDVLDDGRPVLRTLNWTIVVPDAGYTGDAPIGTTDQVGVVWAYATSLVDVRLARPVVVPDTVQEATNRSTNEVVFRAERAAAATWDGCCHFAAGVQVTTCGPLGFAS